MSMVSFYKQYNAKLKSVTKDSMNHDAIQLTFSYDVEQEDGSFHVANRTYTLLISTNVGKILVDLINADSSIINHPDIICKPILMNEIIRMEPTMLLLIAEPKPQDYHSAFLFNPDVYKMLTNPTDHINKILIDLNAGFLILIDNPSDEIIRYTLSSDVGQLRLIEDHTDELLKFAETCLVGAIKYANRPISEDLFMELLLTSKHPEWLIDLREDGSVTVI